MADIEVTSTARLHKEESGFVIDAALDAELGGGGARSAGRSARREGAHDLAILEAHYGIDRPAVS